MIEAPAARALAEQLGQVEERLGRLLVSGWRQASTEADDLRQDAEALVEAGLPELAARVLAVAEAGGPTEALRAIALAKSACQLVRARLPVQGPPAGWTVLAPPTRSKRSNAKTSADMVVPIGRLVLDGREVWACARQPRNRWLLLEPPFPLEEAETAEAVPAAPGGFLSRLRRQIDRAWGGDEGPPAPWMHHLLQGQLVWQARHPIGADAEVDMYTLEGAEWVAEPGAEPFSYRAFYQTLTDRILISGAPAFASGGGFRLMELDRADPAALVWLDGSAAEEFGCAPTEKVWTISWNEGKAIVPVAIVTRPDRGDPPRLIHLIPGAPEHVLTSPR